MASNIGLFLISFFNITDNADITDFFIGGVLATVLLVLALITSIIEYIWRPISCHVPPQFIDSWEEYAENFCRGAQTYYLPLQGQIPANNTEKAQINYAFFFPLLLLAHAVLLRLPKLVWLILSKFSSINLASLLQASTSYSTLDATGRQASVKTAADYLHANFSLRDPGHIRTKFETLKNYWQCVKHPFPVGILSVGAVFMKLFYALIITFVFIKLCHFATIDKSNFGWAQLSDFYAGRERTDVAVFPEIIVCEYQVRALGNVHRFNLQCVLPLNRFYYVLLVILWFFYYFAEILCWITFINSLITTLLPWPRKWFIIRRLHRRRVLIAPMDDPSQFPKHETPKYGHPQSTSISPVELRQFLENHIRLDGYFILKYLSQRGGDLFVYELINYLWQRFVNSGVPPNSFYDRSVEQSPAFRHRFFIDQNQFVHAPASVEIARKFVPTSIPSIPTATPQQQGTPLIRRYGSKTASYHTLDDSKRLLTPQGVEGYWEEPLHQTIKM